MSNRDLRIMACTFCRDPQFQEWANQQTMDQCSGLIGCRFPAHNEQVAKAFILHQCQVASRNDLDTDTDAAARFHNLVRKPFLAWKEGRP